MKKIISAVLVLLLLLGLCACGGEVQGGQTGQNGQTVSDDQNTPGTQAEPDNKTASTETGLSYALMVRVTINPEFVLYLDSEQNILSAEAVNEDARKLFAQLEVTGKPYAEGMASLLGAAYDQGYLKEGTQISIGINAAEEAAFDFSTISAPVSKVEQDKSITTEISMSLLVDEVTEDEDTTVINGQKVYIYHISRNDGVEVGVATVYATRRVLFGDPMQYAVKSVYQGNNGDTSVSYFKDGVLTKAYSTYADGTANTCTYYSNGYPKTNNTVYPNGDYQDETYFENGNLESIEVQQGDTYSEQTFSENGNVLYSTFRNADGTTESLTYYENGNTKSQVFQSNESYSEITFSENGSMVRSSGKNSDGTEYESTYHSNGNLATYEEHFSNGDYQIHTFYESGPCATQKGSIEGYYTETKFDEDGSYQYYYDDSDGGREFFFSGGKIIKAIVGGITYTDAESLAIYTADFFGNQQ